MFLHILKISASNVLKTFLNIIVSILFYFPLRPSPLIFMFLIDMVRQSRVGRSAKTKW